MCSVIIIIYIHIISAKSRGLAAWLWLFNSQARQKAVAGHDFGPAGPSLFWLGLAQLPASGRAKHSTSCNANFGEASVNCAYLCAEPFGSDSDILTGSSQWTLYILA